MAEGSGSPENQEIAKVKPPTVKEVDKPPVSEIKKLEEAPVVEVKKPNETPQTESSMKTIPSLEDDIGDYVDKKKDLKNSPHVVKYLDQAEVENLKSKIFDFYNIPQNVRNNGYKTEIYIVKDESLNELKEREIKLDRYREKRDLKTEEDLVRFEESAKLDAQCHLGINLAISQYEGLVVLRESAGSERNQIHEILHSVSRNVDDIRTSGLMTRAGTDLNEAATEILTLHYEHPDLDTWNLYVKILKEEIRAEGYPEQVAKLLSIIAHTDSQNPFTVKDLAKYYFHDVQIKDASYANSMIGEIVSRMSPILQESVGKCLSSDLKGDI